MSGVTSEAPPTRRRPERSPTQILIIGRALRDFGDGFAAILLPAYLLALGMGPLEVGVISTLSLLGSSLLTRAPRTAGRRSAAAAPRHPDHVRALRGDWRDRRAALSSSSARTGGESKPQTPSALGPSKSIVVRLALLFSLDSFAGGFVVQSLLALWLFERFDLALSAAGIFFFWTGVLSAFSYPVAAWLSTKIGLVNTMVFTHILSSVALIPAAIAPSLHVALGLLLVRAAPSQMDVPTRSSYVVAVVTPPERAAAASFTAVPRSLAAAASPALAAAMMSSGFMALPLLLCGGLKVAYDLLLLWQFRNVRPPEEAVR